VLTRVDLTRWDAEPSRDARLGDLVMRILRLGCPTAALGRSVSIDSIEVDENLNAGHRHRKRA